MGVQRWAFTWRGCFVDRSSGGRLNAVSDPPETLIECDGCGGDAERKRSCSICGGTGVLTAAQRKKRSQDRIRRVSETHIEFSRHVMELVARLEARPRTGIGKLLVLKGHELQAELDHWKIEPPDGDSKTRVLRDLIDWNSQTLDFLAGGR